jgi:hypothetical protein
VEYNVRRTMNFFAELDRALRDSVFLCHASEDKPKARVLYRGLIEAGVEPWLDDEKILPGQVWRDKIRSAVRTSDVVVVCLSNRSITKEGFVQREIAEALDVAVEKPLGTLFVIPARFEECTVPERLAERQWVDLFKAEGLGKLIVALQRRAKQIDAVVPQTVQTC